MKCKECGEQFSAKQYNSEFCCTQHRAAFNNRRALRGSTIYDLAMIIKYEPDAAKKHEFSIVLDNFLTACRDEDNEKRASRFSWKRVLDVAADTLRFR